MRQAKWHRTVIIGVFSGWVGAVMARRCGWFVRRRLEASRR